jgi:hypothetical protein
MDNGLWTVWTATKSVPAHTAHSPDDDGGVGTFSTVKWVLFQLSRFRSNSSSGYFFDCQVGTFWLDKNILVPVIHRLANSNILFCLFSPLFC